MTIFLKCRMLSQCGDERIISTLNGCCLCAISQFSEPPRHEAPMTRPAATGQSPSLLLSVEMVLAPAQQPLRQHVERMTQLYQFGRVERRAPAFPADDLCLTVARQCGKLSAIHVGLGHGARQALADPLLLCDVVRPEHRRTSPCPSRPELIASSRVMTRRAPSVPPGDHDQPPRGPLQPNFQAKI